MGHRTILCAVLIIIQIVYNVAGGEHVRVEVSQGWLEGERLQTVTGDAKYCSFKGIPYAQPPVGKLRFKAPQPPVPWSGIRNATEHGSICPQVDLFSNAYLPGEEDCLFLNVYTCNVKPKHKMPVLVVVHSGVFINGSGNVDMYGPDFFVEQGVVVVTFNYRLHVLGFLCMDTEEVPGNAGLKDQVAALRWVKENIEKFGGDPKRVTIMGLDAGGVSVSLHLLSPMTKGLYKRAISLSGSPFCEWAIPVAPSARPYFIAKQLGLDSENSSELLEFLQAAPVEKLINSNPFVINTEEIEQNILLRKFHYTPVVEVAGSESYMNETIYKSLSEGNVNPADLFYGRTSKEGIALTEPIVTSYLEKYATYPQLFSPKKIFYSTTVEMIFKASSMVRNHYFPNKTLNMESISEFISYITDNDFVYDIHNFLDMLPNIHNSGRYFYRFSAFSNRNYYGKAGEKYGIYGAGHTDDLFYLFDPKKLNMKITKNSREYRLVQLVTTIFTNFIKYGNPTPDSSLGVKWPKYNKATRRFVDINDSLTVRRHAAAKTIEFWDKVYGASKQQIYMRY